MGLGLGLWRARLAGVGVVAVDGVQLAGRAVLAQRAQHALGVRNAVVRKLADVRPQALLAARARARLPQRARAAVRSCRRSGGALPRAGGCAAPGCRANQPIHTASGAAWSDAPQSARIGAPTGLRP